MLERIRPSRTRPSSGARTPPGAGPGRRDRAPAGATDPGDDALAAHARESLAGFKVPAAFDRLDALPRTPGRQAPSRRRPRARRGRPPGELARPGGDAIGWRVDGSGPAPVLLLHGTLSTAQQLGPPRPRSPRPRRRHRPRASTAAARARRRLARAAPARRRHARRRPPSPTSTPAGSAAAPSSASASAAWSRSRWPPATRTRVDAVVAWEPPYGAGRATRRASPGSAASPPTPQRAHDRGRPGAAAETFLRAVAGDAAWDRLPAAGPRLPRPRGRRRAGRRGAHRPRPRRPRAHRGAGHAPHGRRERAVLRADRRRARPTASRAPAARTLERPRHPPPITDPRPSLAAIRRRPRPRSRPPDTPTTTPAVRPGARPMTDGLPPDHTPVRRRAPAPATPPRRPRSGPCSTGSPAATTS